MANVATPIDSTMTRQKIMAFREEQAQQLRVRWAILAEEKKQRHKEALEYARRNNNDEETSNVIG
jgi:hypothetical protein|tara:strand:- start:271 stop:465 length:195 start_codon:yes stop_codon:yes gene_type:complete